MSTISWILVHFVTQSAMPAAACRPLRVLCLHGFRQSADKMRGRLSQALQQKQWRSEDPVQGSREHLPFIPLQDERHL